ncbi:MAG: adenylosuccinate lyase [Clostridia bacterium]|nr:adenylosuccinate lyase [Clostridia bacterium]
MSENRRKYVSALSGRYASDEMQYLFSDDFKFSTWRKLWVALAKAEKAAGLSITDKQISEMESHVFDINYDTAEEFEKELRHDVMSHIRAFGEQCPDAQPIIHLGATSCYVGDNTDIIILREASKIILKKAAQVVKNLAAFAEKYKALPCLAYTHLQPAQLTTVGKRAALWANDLINDIKNLQFQIDNLKLLGSKGTTGTQASFLELFGGDEQKVKDCERYIAEYFGFDSTVPVSGQTYSRKTDYYFLSALSGFAQSAYKFADDLRLLQSFEELEEPFGSSQVGSSAMPYKRNPMRCERICSLSRYVINNALNAATTASTQWLERSLDDSANRRLSISEGFLALDGVLNLYINVTSGIVVYEKVINRRVAEKLPFMATENIMMESVKRGADRQQIHGIIHDHSNAAVSRIKLEGGKNDLIERLASDPGIPLEADEIAAQISPELYTGRCVSQVDEFLKDYANPVINAYCTENIKYEPNV